MEIILLILLLILIYKVGKLNGEKETFTKVKRYITISNNWNEFLEKISKDWNEWEVLTWLLI